MPSITTTLKDSGIVNFTLEEEEDSNLAGYGRVGGELTHNPSSNKDDIHLHPLDFKQTCTCLHES